MHENVIFCYSGTGNCLNLAKNIAKGIGGADIIMMRSKPKVSDVTEAKKVGFVFPCYGGGAPEDVLKYVKAVKVNPDAYTFGICQPAVYKGTGLAELNRIIPLKYWSVVTHHCSCVWLFPHNVMVPFLNKEKAQERSENRAAQIAKDIMNEKTSKRPFRNPLNVIENKIWPVIANIKIKAFSVSDKCISCGQCVKLCPRQNIKMKNGKPRFGTNCAQCLGCLQYCPKNAISIGRITDRREHYHNPKVKAEDLMEDIIQVDI